MSKKRGKYLRIQQIDDFSYLLKRIDRSAIGVLTRRAQDLSTAIPTRTCHASVSLSTTLFDSFTATMESTAALV